VVVKDGNVQLFLEPFLDLKAPRRRNVFEVDAAECDRDVLDRLDDLVGVFFLFREKGKASLPPNSLKSWHLPSITGIAAAGPISPRPSTAVPSETTAIVLPLIVRFQALPGSAAIASQTRATPGVYAMERSSRFLIGTLLLTSILPPRCSRKV